MEKNCIKKPFIICYIAIIIIIVGLSGCMNNSNTNNGEDTNGNNTIPTSIEEMIIGIWERDDNRTFEYKANGTLILESAAYEYRYWFKGGFLFDTSEGLDESWIYKYNISFENEDTMILTYLGYYYDNQWNNDTSQTYLFHKAE